MPKKPFDDLATINKLLRLYKGVYSMSQISGIFKCEEKIIREVLRFSGIKRKTSGEKRQILSSKKIQELLKLISLGTSINSVAKRYALDRQSVRYQIKKYNVGVGSKVPRLPEIDNLSLKRKKKETITTSDAVKGSYDHLIFEPINNGSNYDEICKKQGVKVYKGSSMFTYKVL